MSDKILPPRLKNWTKGGYQVGVFVRTAKGSVIEFCNDQATKAHMELFMLLIQPNKHVEEFVTTHRAEIEAAVKKANSK